MDAANLTGLQEPPSEKTPRGTEEAPETGKEWLNNKETEAFSALRRDIPWSMSALLGLALLIAISLGIFTLIPILLAPLVLGGAALLRRGPAT